MEYILGISLLVALAVLAGVFVYFRSRVKWLESHLAQSRLEQRAVFDLIDTLGARITSDLNLEAILKLLTEYMVEATGARAGAVFLMTPQRDTLERRVMSGPFPDLRGDLAQPLPQGAVRVGEGLVGLVAGGGQPLLVTDATADPRMAPAADPVQSMILCPLRVRDRVLGVFVVVNQKGDRLFDRRDMELLQALTAQAAITVRMARLHESHARHRELQHDLEVAREFQSMLLPSVFPQIDGYEIYGINRPALVIGGDLYDVFEIDEHHWGFVVADVVGKGISGALVMATTRAVLRASAAGCLSPREVLQRVNRQLLADTKEHVFITATYGILDTRSGHFKFARAGHEPLIVTGEPGTSPRQYCPDGIALGVVDSSVFACLEEQTIQIQDGETALLYTDGVIEAMNDAAEEYAHERLDAWLTDHHCDGVRGLVEGLLEDIGAFTRNYPANDDVTILAMRKVPRVIGCDKKWALSGQIGS